MENIGASLAVSVLALTVIFLVLGILIVLIKFLDHFWPYQASPTPTAPPPSSNGTSSEEQEHIAVIHSVMAMYLGKPSSEIHIRTIQSQ